MAQTMRYLTVVQDAVWDELVALFAARGVDVLPIPQDADEPNGEHGTYYFLAPTTNPKERH